MVHLEMIESDKKNPWLLFIHGFGGSHQMWNKQVNIYKDKFNICLVDLPGHAGIELTKKSLESANIFKDVAKSIVEQIRAYGIQKITTISVSLGTLINYFMLKYDSDLIDEAVLSGAICGTTVGYKTIMKSVELLKNIVPYKILIKMCCNVLMPKKSHKKSRRYLLKEALKMNKKEFVFWYTNLVQKLDSMTENTLTSIATKKIHLISGDEDYVFLKKMKTFAKNNEVPLKIIKDCGHVCSLHKWREFNTYLDTFVLQKA